MERSKRVLDEHADSKVEEICLRLKASVSTFYARVYFLRENACAKGVQPSLYLHRSIPTVLSEGALFTLFAVDEGDLEYEARLQAVEKCLRQMPELRKLERETAPDTMLKDMIVADILLTSPSDPMKKEARLRLRKSE